MSAAGTLVNQVSVAEPDVGPSLSLSTLGDLAQHKCSGLMRVGADYDPDFDPDEGAAERKRLGISCFLNGS
jgi:hypothetical protein